MRKWPLFCIAGLTCLGLSGPAAASDEKAIPPALIGMMCMPLIQQGNAIPAAPSNNLNTIKVCMANCDTIYQSLGNAGRIEEMMLSTNNCRKSLNNLYFASVAQTITEQLDQQSKQKNANNSAMPAAFAAMILQQQQQQKNKDEITHPDADANTETSTPPANPPPQPSGPPDNVNW